MNARSIIVKGSIALSIFTFSSFGQIGIIVNNGLAGSIDPAVTTLINDIETIEGKTVWLDNTQFNSSSSISALRSTLRTRHYNFGLEGVILIGDLPIAQYEIENDFQQYGYAEFPFDLYYMDIDGNWLDTAINGMWNGQAKTGVFDGHSAGTGDMLAEIWVSRITGSIVSGLGSEVNVINQYLARVHSRMTGNDPLAEKMVICGSDTDWPSCVSWAGASLLKYASANVTTYLRSNPAATQDSRDNWITALRAGQESAALFEHSSPTLHCVLNYFTSSDYLTMPTMGGLSNVRFYNLFACSNCRYTVTDVLGGLYAWGHNGLIAVGSTKTGSMLSFDRYNTDLGNGVCFGGAFLNWLNTRVMPYTLNNIISWHFGMTLLGAGTLHQQKYTAIDSLTVASGRNYQVATLQIGALQFIDRNFTFTNVADYAGREYIQTANNDKYSISTDFIRFVLTQPSFVFVAHDDRIIQKPSWLSQFTLTEDNLVSTDGNPMSIYCRYYEAGTVILGGNLASSSSSNQLSMYSVIVSPQVRPSISNLHVTNGRTYEISAVALGEEQYVDREYVFTQIASFGGRQFIQAFNNDKFTVSDSFLSFALDMAATIYVAHDDRITQKPDWLLDFTDTGENIQNSDDSHPMSVYQKIYDAGNVTLGGNAQTTPPNKFISMYTVIIGDAVSSLPLLNPSGL